MPYDVIDQAIQMISTREIVNYRFDKDKMSLVKI